MIYSCLQRATRWIGRAWWYCTTYQRRLLKADDDGDTMMICGRCKANMIVKQKEDRATWWRCPRCSYQSLVVGDNITIKTVDAEKPIKVGS